MLRKQNRKNKRMKMEKLICDVIQWNYDTDEMWNDEKKRVLCN